MLIPALGLAGLSAIGVVAEAEKFQSLGLDAREYLSLVAPDQFLSAGVAAVFWDFAWQATGFALIIGLFSRVLPFWFMALAFIGSAVVFWFVEDPGGAWIEVMVPFLAAAFIVHPSVRAKLALPRLAIGLGVALIFVAMNALLLNSSPPSVPQLEIETESGEKITGALALEESDGFLIRTCEERYMRWVPVSGIESVVVSPGIGAVALHNTSCWAKEHRLRAERGRLKLRLRAASR